MAVNFVFRCRFVREKCCRFVRFYRHVRHHPDITGCGRGEICRNIHRPERFSSIQTDFSPSAPPPPRDTFFRRAAGELERHSTGQKPSSRRSSPFAPCQNVGFDDVVIDNLTVSQFKITGGPHFGTGRQYASVQFYPVLRQPEFALRYESVRADLHNTFNAAVTSIFFDRSHPTQTDSSSVHHPAHFQGSCPIFLSPSRSIRH